MGKKRTDRQDLLPGTLDMLILKTLSLGVMHGYGIAEHIRQRVGRGAARRGRVALSGASAAAVPGPDRLEWVNSVNNRRARYYRLTPAGAGAGGGRVRLRSADQAITRVMRNAEG